jgi:thioredoxin 1
MNKMGIVIAVILITGLAVYAYFSFRKMKNTPLVAPNEFITELYSSNFNKNISKGWVLVDFWAEWCMPCKIMAPILNELAVEMQGKMKIAKLDVDANRQVMQDKAIKGIPTLILFKNGKEVKRFVGVKTRNFLLAELQKVM